MINKSDSSYMEYALNLANSKLGLVSPNPSVGCVIVKNDIIVGIGITANGGRPHAETQAIAMAEKILLVRLHMLLWNLALTKQQHLAVQKN